MRDSNEGHAIAKALASNSIVIAKSHGLFAAARDIKATLWDFIVADMASEIHVEARKLGVSAPQLESATLTKSRGEVRDRQCESSWNSSVRKLEQTRTAQL